ncbi:hypothetical protein CORC01_09262 [Colletotrichum orchidophilum]|uniref:Uncharacterized protein n=1 Tax=Colletotrichum orchidophilum TaxID=1209926 RepID=A0A1G4B1U3_9PEZI|nr:uncharacterized protein CORC01_09262 [Colletotrichum orchidophilum]OHE95390.1 hypothetical protein CORC01_09262 [Colletotrichum orchidophilum]
MLDLQPTQPLRRGITTGFLACPVDPVGLQPRELGYFDEIYRKRDKCPLCWLLFNAAHSASEEIADRFEGNRPNVRQTAGYDGLALLECVELFSGRLMTFQGDRLPALEGMSAISSPPLLAILFYEIPDSYFDFALIWEKKICGF